MYKLWSAVFFFFVYFHCEIAASLKLGGGGAIKVMYS